MKQQLIILGTGGNALDVLDVIDAINSVSPTWEVTGFLDDARPVGSRFHSLDILGPLCEAARFSESLFINVIGSDRSYRRRAEIVESTGLAPNRFATLVHPMAAVSSRSQLGRGTCINFGVSIGGEVTVGAHVSLGPGCIVGHNATIGDHCIVAPGAIVSGFVRLGAGCYLGAGGMVRQYVQVGEQALIGMGAVVVRDVTAGTIVIGNPARPLELARNLAPHSPQPLKVG